MYDRELCQKLYDKYQETHSDRDLNELLKHTIKLAEIVIRHNFFQIDEDTFQDLRSEAFLELHRIMSPHSPRWIICESDGGNFNSLLYTCLVRRLRKYQSKQGHLDTVSMEDPDFDFEKVLEHDNDKIIDPSDVVAEHDSLRYLHKRLLLTVREFRFPQPWKSVYLRVAREFLRTQEIPNPQEVSIPGMRRDKKFIAAYQSAVYLLQRSLRECHEEVAI